MTIEVDFSKFKNVIDGDEVGDEVVDDGGIEDAAVEAGIGEVRSDAFG